MKSYHSKLNRNETLSYALAVMMIDTTLRTFRPESRLSYELQELVQYSEMRSVNLVKFYVVEQEWESLVKF